MTLKSSLALKKLLQENSFTEILYFQHPIEIQTNLEKTFNGFNQILLICDENTRSVLGQGLFEFLCSNLKSKFKIFSFKEPRLKAEMRFVNQITEIAKSSDLLLAIGTGTINDLTKLASKNLEIPYIIFPTAISMNGFSSSFASIIDPSGKKTSIKAHLPKAIFCHYDSLMNAPKNLTVSGVADLLSLKTCWADWLMSHLIFKTFYEEKFYKQMTDLLEEFANFKKIFEKNLKACESLMNITLISGFSMHLAGGSMPYSQGEHMIAHFLDEENSEFAKLFHGQQIALTSNFMSKLQQFILKKDNLHFKNRNFSPRDFNQSGIFDSKKAIFEEVKINFTEFKKDFFAKYLSCDQISFLDSIYEDFEIDIFSLHKYIKNYETLKNVFATRDRLTFLDLNFFSDNFDEFSFGFFDK